MCGRVEGGWVCGKEGVWEGRGWVGVWEDGRVCGKVEGGWVGVWEGRGWVGVWEGGCVGE